MPRQRPVAHDTPFCRAVAQFLGSRSYSRNLIRVLPRKIPLVTHANMALGSRNKLFINKLDSIAVVAVFTAA